MMAETTPEQSRRRARLRRWIRRGFLIWAVASTTWLADSYRTRGVPAAALRGDAKVSVVEGPEALAFTPVASPARAGLVFICGSGVSASAYAPLLRPIAEAGRPVFIVKLPWRFAPLASQKEAAIGRVRGVMAAHPEVDRWVLSGHSLGAALACRAAGADPDAFAGLVLLGTTHPRDEDLSALTIPVTKVYGSVDGVAPAGRMFANRGRLPRSTRWVEIPGGNHSQFGHYGRQLMDGRATIDREAQQAVARGAIADALDAAAP